MTEENGTEKLLEAGSDCRYPEFAEALKTYALLDAFTFQTAGETVENKAGLLEKPTDGENATEPDGKETNTDAAEAATVTYSSSMTLAQYIVSLANDATLEDHLSTVYPIVNALTEPQRAALSLGGLSDVGGKALDTYNFDQFHTIYTSDKIKVLADTDGGLIHAAGFHDLPETAFSRISRDNKKMIFHTAMYFGVSYTYNPYRAITGVSGLLTSYTEASNQIKYSGMKTPAGSMLACNVSMQGCPSISAGITAGYYNPMTMTFPLYTNYEARQKSDLSWMTDKETEVQTRYLLTSGPRNNVLPLKEGDIAFVTHENPGQMDASYRCAICVRPATMIIR